MALHSTGIAYKYNFAASTKEPPQKNTDMNDSKHKITTLAADMEYIFREEFGDELEMMRVCKDHSDPLLHTDQNPVLSISQDDFLGVFNKNAKHYFIAPDMVFRLATYCKIKVHHIIALMLKAIWESYISDMAGLQNKPKADLESILNDHILMEEYIDGFKPHRGKIFRLLKAEFGGSETNIGYDNFEFILQDLIYSKQFIFEIKSLDTFYPDNDYSERKLLFSQSEEQRENYLRAKELWILKSEDLDDMLLTLERKKRLNLSIENSYMETFRSKEMEKSDLIFRVEKYTLVLKISNERPDLSLRAVLRKALKNLMEAESRRNQIRNKIARSRNKMDFIFYPRSPLHCIC